ncbi:hypothetical protein EI94DRAFT_1697993 [Lactarius quietus]|nr:hypothetical protein EI94DRAFT_1699290 [Lactarius quietus]KAF8271570.1 hypothetical protein EI94DRAFT_1697993 [Lactarius quietus]
MATSAFSLSLVCIFCRLLCLFVACLPAPACCLSPSCLGSSSQAMPRFGATYFPLPPSVMSVVGLLLSWQTIAHKGKSSSVHTGLGTCAFDGKETTCAIQTGQQSRTGVLNRFPNLSDYVVDACLRVGIVDGFCAMKHEIEIEGSGGSGLFNVQGRRGRRDRPDYECERWTLREKV